MRDLITILKEHAATYSAVVRFNAAKDRLLSLDFTNSNTELTPTMLKDTKLFSKYINDKLANASALYGIGGYAEHRTIYSRSELFDGADHDEEPRRLHLGTDIWGSPIQR